MRKTSALILFLTIVLLLAGCQRRDETPVIEGALAPAAAMQAVALAPAAEPAATAEVSEEPVIDECLECHVDKDRLIDTAKPEEGTAESESKGVG